MTAPLRDYQWELGGLVFGYDCAVDHEADSDPGSYSWRTQDTPSPTGDATVMGRDLIEPGTWNFKLFTNSDDDREALAELAKIAKVWRGDDVRGKPGEVMALRYGLGGRVRRVYGRPRRFAAPLTTELVSGLIRITSDFKTVSELFFDDIEESIPVTAIAPTTGGFEAPFETPLTTENQLATRPHTFTVYGDQSTPMVVDFHGPSDDAFLEIDGERLIQLTGHIPPGVTITVDARPWKMSVYRNDGAGVAGMLHRRSRLPRLLLTPGVHQATYGGYDETGASSATVKWRRAYPSV